MSAHVHHMILSHLSIYVINVIWGMKIYVNIWFLHTVEMEESLLSKYNNNIFIADYMDYILDKNKNCDIIQGR